MDDKLPQELPTDSLLAIDPGNEVSAWVNFRLWPEGEENETPFEVLGFGRATNPALRSSLAAIKRAGTASPRTLLIEMPRASGIPVSNELFETCVQIGMYRAIWVPWPWGYVFRGDVKSAVCGVANTKDSNVRAALVEYWGGSIRADKGKKCSRCKGKGWFGAGRPTCSECEGAGWIVPPGPLYGMAKDEWAALGVAFWWYMERKLYHAPPPPRSPSRGSAKRRLR